MMQTTDWTFFYFPSELYIPSPLWNSRHVFEPFFHLPLHLEPFTSTTSSTSSVNHDPSSLCSSVDQKDIYILALDFSKILDFVPVIYQLSTSTISSFNHDTTHPTSLVCSSNRITV